MSLIDFLGAMATPANQVAAGAQAGQMEGRDLQQKQTMSALALLRQQQQDALAKQEGESKMRLEGANTNYLNTHADILRNPPPKEKGFNILPSGSQAYDSSGNLIATGTPKEENETWSLSNDYLVNGKRTPVKVSNRGAVQTLTGQPVDGSQVQPYDKPEKPVIIQGQNPEDKTPIFARVMPSSGPATPIEGIQGKPSATGGGNALTQGPMNAARANLDAAMTGMKDFEAKLKQNPDLYTKYGAALGAMASSPTANTATGPWGAANSLASNASMEKIQKDYPELWQYITRKKYVAEAILNTHRRPNQTQYEIEQELSGAGPGAGPLQIDMGADRRQRMYNEVFGNPGQGTASPTGGKGVASPTGKVITKAQYDYLVSPAGGETPQSILRAGYQVKP